MEFAIISYIVGVIIGWIIGRFIRPKIKPSGVLLDRSEDPSEGPYFILELNERPEEIVTHEYITLRVDCPHSHK